MIEELHQSYNAAKDDANRAIEVYDRLLVAGQTHVANDRARSVQLLNHVIGVLEKFK